MRFRVLSSGRIVTVKNVHRYRVDWSGRSASKFQYNVKQWLKKYWESDIVFEEFPMVGSRNRFDFYNANINVIVEAHGKQHVDYVPFFHGSRASGQIDQLRRDHDKQKYADLNNIRLIEIFYDDILNEELANKVRINE